MSFPLADWINAHPDAPHHLAHSGMVDSLDSLPRALSEAHDPDPVALRASLARIYGVSPSRIFLTHGASEGNSVALVYLARATARRNGPDAADLRSPARVSPDPRHRPGRRLPKGRHPIGGRPGRVLGAAQSGRDARRPGGGRPLAGGGPHPPRRPDVPGVLGRPRVDATPRPEPVAHRQLHEDLRRGPAAGRLRHPAGEGGGRVRPRPRAPARPPPPRVDLRGPGDPLASRRDPPGVEGALPAQRAHPPQGGRRAAPPRGAGLVRPRGARVGRRPAPERGPASGGARLLGLVLRRPDRRAAVPDPPHVPGGPGGVPADPVPIPRSLAGVRTRTPEAGRARVNAYPHPPDTSVEPPWPQRKRRRCARPRR